MRWLAIALMLCGVGINQSFYFASMVEMLWEAGTLSSASAVAWLHRPHVLTVGRQEGDRSSFAANPPAI